MVIIYWLLDLSYEARPFTFYIFPRPYSRQAPDRRFLCQVGNSCQCQSLTGKECT